MSPLSLSQIAQILGDVPIINGAATVDTRLSSHVTSSTADVSPGALFVAVRGFTQDGHTFVSKAFESGAIAAVVEDAAALEGRPGFIVPNSRLALSRLASAFAGDPSSKLKVIGITGTNGKTTTHWIIYHALNALGVGALRIGTLGTECMGKNSNAGALTSPDPVSLHRFLAEAVAQGAAACVMETSSHALHQARVEDVQFDVGIFTNLSRDHLDYHGTLQHYFEAKRHLFELLSRNLLGARAAIINLDDEHGQELHRYTKSLGLNDWSFGRSLNAAVQLERVAEKDQEMTLNLKVRALEKSISLQVPFIGPRNAENVAAAFAACLSLGCDAAELVEAFRTIPQVPGRLERIGSFRPRVFVDFAHTPDALHQAINAVRPSTSGKLWVVFGCGGDRDRGKRPQMGAIAAAAADYVVVTSDNPRTEDPAAIISDILSSGHPPLLAEPDRRRAIEFCVKRANVDDTILIAGKGHEDYQIIGTEKIHFSDQEISREVLEASSR